ncbi:transcriptional repressor LexA [Rarobacter incanus]|uniref:transcriptional repressor LexA n=1 Tax=Rarobacter incanus TaxID=153494 RepID=UPI003CCC8A12
MLQVIRESLDARGYAPSMREIGLAVGMVSPSSVKYQLLALEDKGYLRRDKHRPRAMELTAAALSVTTGKDAPRPAAAAPQEAPSNTAGVDTASIASQVTPVPLVGRIAAGSPILADQQVEDVFPLPKQLVGDGEVFMLKVAGDSMVDAAICDGDWVVVRSQPVAESGQIVAALLDDEATVKTLRRADGHVWLIPHNEQYLPINGDQATIIGIVVAVLRSI